MKRKVSELSYDSLSIYEPPHKIQKVFGTNYQLLEQYIHNKAKKQIRHKIDYHERNIRKNDLALVAILTAKEREPSKAKQYDEQIADLEKSTYKSQLQKFNLQRNEEYFIGALIVFIRENYALQNVNTEAYLAKLYSHPEMFPANRARSVLDTLLRKVWEKACKEIYDVENPSPESETLWCCISHSWFQPQLITTAQIIPQDIGGFNAGQVFGDHDAHHGHLYDVKNGLIINKELEKALLKGQLIIVPVENSDNTERTELQVEVIDEKLLRQRPSLQGRKLQFRSKNQPGLKYLYFTMLTAFFRHKRLETINWRPDSVRFANANLWGSPGELWVRGTVMVTISRGMGLVADLEKFLGMELSQTKLWPPY